MPAPKKPAPKRATIEQVRSTSLPEEEVYVPAWDSTVLVRGLSFADELALVGDNGEIDPVILLERCVVEPKLTTEDARAIIDGPSPIGSTLITEIGRLNGDGVAEEALKSFPAGTSD